MVQALPLVRSGVPLSTEQKALACASHQGAAIHTDRVSRWLADLGLGDDDLRCGPQEPSDIPARDGLIRAGEVPCQWHNNCSGKHAGFLTLNRHLGGSADYIEPDHPVQKAVRAAFEDACGEDSPGYGIDGCSAPNFAVSLTGLARAAQRFAAAGADSAEGQLRDAMMAHPELVAGEGRACTALMRALAGKAAVKTGAEGVFVGILPGTGHGVALKIADGATRAAEAVMTALLVRLGAMQADDPVARAYTDAPLINRRGIAAAHVRAVAALRA
jgi:L-asparaginase II